MFLVYHRDIVDISYEVIAKIQLNDLYSGMCNGFPPRLEIYLEEKYIESDDELSIESESE